MPANSAKDAYRIVSLYLIKNAKNVSKASKVKVSQKEEIDKLVGNKYVIAVDLLIEAFYDIEKYVSDGEPMEILYEKVETICE
jgi:hypothetical protein